MFDENRVTEYQCDRWQPSGLLLEQKVNYIGQIWAFFGQFESLMWPGSHFVKLKLCCSVPSVHMILSQTSCSCPGLLHYSLWFCVTEIASSSCKWSMLHIKSTQNVPKWYMNTYNWYFHEGSLLANGTLRTSFGSCKVTWASNFWVLYFEVSYVQNFGK